MTVPSSGPAAAVIADEGIATSVTSLDAAATPATRGGTRRRAVRIATALSLMVGLGLVAVLLLRHPTAAPEPPRSARDVVPSSEIEAPTAATPAAPSAAAPTASASAASSVAIGKPITGARPRPHAKKPGAACSPYVIDSHGRKQFNEECLR